MCKIHPTRRAISPRSPPICRTPPCAGWTCRGRRPRLRIRLHFRRQTPKRRAWFRAIANAPISVVTIPVVLKQRRLGSLLIVADPSDEIDEVWSAAQKQAAAGGALALAVLLRVQPLHPLGRLDRSDWRERRWRASRRATIPPGSNRRVAGICRYLPQDQQSCGSLVGPSRDQRPN